MLDVLVTVRGGPPRTLTSMSNMELYVLEGQAAVMQAAQGEQARRMLLLRIDIEHIIRRNGWQEPA